MTRESPTDVPLPRREIELCAAWAGQPADFRLVTRDGADVAIVFRGTWTHGFGPDFRNGMVVFDEARLATGGIEMHLRTSGWHAHGHHTDSAYDDVMLHVVAYDDGAETRTSSGRVVPVAVLPATLTRFSSPQRAWDLVGGEVCAEGLSRSTPGDVLAILWALGDARFAGRVDRFEGDLHTRPAAQLLYAAILDGLGYAENRAQMLELAGRLPLALLEQRLSIGAPSDRFETCAALMLGVAGFLPMAPSDGHLSGLSPNDLAAIESRWTLLSAGWTDLAMHPGVWKRARVRPANHPARRIVEGATLIARCGSGLLAHFTDSLRSGESPLEALRPSGARLVVGLDRANAIAASSVLPLLAAIAEQTGEDELGDAAARAWEQLPASSGNESTRRAKRPVAGSVRLPALGGRGEQGLLHLDRTLCTPRRCYECPIAHAVVADAALATRDKG